MKKILVLLSTYNGEKYLEEQLNSIFCQNGVDVYIYVRDDGSNDGTHSILERYSQSKKIKWYTGANLKPAFSFIDLIFTAPDIFDYYAFCDQDDVWLPNKLLNAVEKLSENNDEIPALYNCLIDTVDSELNKISEIYHKNFENNTLYELLNLGVPGCSYVFNKALFNVARKNKPKVVCMHDAWIAYLNFAVGGIFISDERCGILYRQHNNNTVGASKRSLRQGFYDIFFDSNIKKSDTIREIISQHANEINEVRKKEMNLIANYRKSLRNKLFLLFTRYYGNGYTKKSFLKIKLCILFNNF